MPASWCVGGKWRRQPGSLPFSKVVDRVVSRNGRNKKQSTEIAHELWSEVCALLIEDGRASLPGLSLELKIKRVKGSEKRHGKRLQKIVIKFTPKGRLKAQLDAMSAALNTDDSFMDAVILAPGQRQINPFYPFNKEEDYLAYKERQAAKKAEREAEREAARAAAFLAND